MCLQQHNFGHVEQVAVLGGEEKPPIDQQSVRCLDVEIEADDLQQVRLGNDESVSDPAKPVFVKQVERVQAQRCLAAVEVRAADRFDLLEDIDDFEAEKQCTCAVLLS